ncbi:MAG: D-glycero-beta-D-manno-heptose 1,7-bisphosphate 7-phosphatase [Desulfobacterales bacterium]|nr:D-glycero-beta-D-manno-heptose 1,7-bisphosphate 7-phosphatase [Desulfobacterales bacterium]
MAGNLLQKIVFLDRDGVINRDSPYYIKSWAEFEFLPGSLDAIKRLTQNGFTIIIITNQSVVNRKMVSPDDLQYIFEKMCESISMDGGVIKDIFFCPHTPDDDCNCRKPEPGLINKACQKYDIDPSDSVMVGDSVKDIQCARNAGCGKAILVKTGNGIESENILAHIQSAPDFVANNLSDAADWIIKNHPAN